jgi:uncharacterized protein (TIGR02246 family)
MKKVFATLALITAGLMITHEAKSQSNEKVAVETLVRTYFDALNASDVNKVASLSTADGVLLATGAPTASGNEQVKGTFQYVFDNFKYNLQVTIGDVTVAGKYAFVSSTSKGSYVVKATGQTAPDEYRELFVIEKVKGNWKIARYMYNRAK